MIQKVCLRLVFNHVNSEVFFNKGINIIVGENGSGKTNIIEGIFFGLYCETIKNRTLNEICYNMKDEQPRNNIRLETDLFNITRFINRANSDSCFDKKNQVRITGRTNVNQFVETTFIPKFFFSNIVYTPQEFILEITNMTNTEKIKFIDKLLNLYYITEFDKLLTKYNNQLKDKKDELLFFVKKMEVSKEQRRLEILNELERLNQLIEKAKTELETWQSKKELIELHAFLKEKENALQNYINTKKELQNFLKLKQEVEHLTKLSYEVQNKLKVVQEAVKQKEKELQKIQTLMKEKKCPYCLRTLSDKDFLLYENLTLQLQEELLLYKTSETELHTHLLQTREVLTNKEKILKKISEQNLRNFLAKLKNFILSLPSRKKLKDTLQGHEIPENRLLVLKKLEEVEKLHQQLLKQKDALNIELQLLEDAEQKLQQISIVKQEINKIDTLSNELNDIKNFLKNTNMAAELRWHILQHIQLDKLYDLFELGKLHFDKNFNFFINNLPINLASGSQKVALAIITKLALLKLTPYKLLILDEPTMYMDKKRIKDLMLLLETVYRKQFVEQLIIITHEPALMEIAHHTIKVIKTNEGAKIEYV